MKRFFCLLLAFIILCVCCMPTFAASPKLTVGADKTSANIGDTVTVTVSLSANSNLGGLDFYLNYDKDSFQYISSSETTLFGLTELNDKTGGKVKFSGISKDAVTASGKLLSVKFKVLKVGGKLTVTVNEACDTNNKSVVSTVGTSSLTIACAHGNPNWKTVKKSTCTEKGSETATCEYCSKELSREISLEPHSFGAWTVKKEATETQKGEKIRVCSVCEKTEAITIPVIATTTVPQTDEATTDEETQTTEALTEAESRENSSKEENISNKNDDKKNGKGYVKTAVAIVSAVSSFALGIAAGAGLMFLITEKKRK